MKFQLSSLVTLAILYGTVTATPIPAENTEDQSIADALLGTAGQAIGSLWGGIVPNSALQGSARGAGACIVQNGQLLCPQRRDLEEEDQSIADSIFNTAGNALGGLFSGIVPNSGLQGAARGAGACIVRNGQVLCPQRRDLEEEDQSIADALFNTAGNAIGGLWRGIVPNSALGGSARGAGACIQQNGQLFCPQRRDLEEEDQSIADALFNTAGGALGGLFSGIVPNTALQGAARGAGACIVRNGQVLCPQRRDLEEEDQSIADSLFGTAGNVIGGLWRGIVPNSGLRGSAQGAGACIQQNGQLLCPQRRDLEEEDQSIADALFNTAGNALGGLFSGIVPNTAIQGAARGAGACLVRNGQLLCPSS